MDEPAAGLDTRESADTTYDELLDKLATRGFAGTTTRDIAFTSYGDGWTFLPEYLLDVERASGHQPRRRT